MMKPNEDDLWRIVCASSRGILATVAPDGMPHLTNVHYLVDPDQPLVRLTTTTNRTKGRNLAREPRATLHVQGEDWFNFAAVAGAVSIAVARERGDAVIDELHDLISTLRGPADRPAFDDEMLADHRMVVRLSVDRIYGQVVRRNTRTSQ
jgi:PPOX class probable F420-dependent enzyme